MTATVHAQSVRPLASDFVTVYESPDPDSVYCYSPGITRLGSGRLVATLDLGGPGVERLSGPKGERHYGQALIQGKIFTSDDAGRTWTHRTDFPFMHARPFVAGNSLYVLGQSKDIRVIRSDDGGETWTSPTKLTSGEIWGQAPCNVHYANDCVYLVMEHHGHYGSPGWSKSECAMVLMRGRLDADLTQRESWTFAKRLTFGEAVSVDDLEYFGVPLYVPDTEVAPGRHCPTLHGGETHVVQFSDPNHLFHDPDGKTFFLWARLLSGNSGTAVVLKVRETGEAAGTGPMETTLATVPSGKKLLFAPLPGGQMKFHILYDEETKLYWLLSTQATDSMIRPDRMPADRYNLPNNERRRLQLHFSKNMIDWCFAGMVAIGPEEKASRHYASMVIDGDDLHVLSRSGDERAKDAHDVNLITFHTVKDFRGLVY